MKAKTIIALAVAVTTLAIVTAFASYVFVWGKGTLSVGVGARETNLWNFFYPATDVFEDGKKIGTAYSFITLPVGKHVLTFSDINSSYVTPESAIVDISVFNECHINIEYKCKTSVLHVSSLLHDPLNDSSVPATYIYIDNQTVNLSYGRVTLIYQEAGNHIITFPDIEGYKAPGPVTVSLETEKRQDKYLNYEKILTLEAQATVQANKEAAQHKAWINHFAEQTFNLSRDDPKLYYVKFLQWTLDNRVIVPVCYFDVTTRGMTVRIAQYAGSLISDREKVLDSLNNKLVPLGYNLNSTSVHCYNSGGNEYIVNLDLSISLRKESDPQQTQETIYRFKNDSNIPNFCPSFIPVGMSYDFGDSGGIFVKVGDLTRPLTAVYSGFQNFLNTPTGYQQGYWNAYSSISVKSMVSYYTADKISQAIALVKGGIMGSALVDFPNFCRSLLWKP